MRWSVSKAKAFQKCQRQWYYTDILANHITKDPFRRNAFLLKQLKSIQAWRGQVVDKVIEKNIIPKLIYEKRVPSINNILFHAKKLTDSQLEFGKKNRYREDGLVKTRIGDAYCAFFDVEFKSGLDNKELADALEDIKIALTNLLNSQLLREITVQGSKIYSQSKLSIPYEGFRVMGTPDLVVFLPDKPPIIIDWKVHKERNTDYWLQLSVYAFILSQVELYKYFRNIPSPHSFKAEDIRVIEYQLLLDEQKEYNLTTNDIGDAEDFIYSTGSLMNEFYTERKKLDVTHFELTKFPSICKRCQFQKLCSGVGNCDSY